MPRLPAATNGGKAHPDSWDTAELLKPPRPLGKHGKALWGSITAEYEVRDAGNIEQLASACAALDRAESCRAQIAADGVTITVNGQIKDHPLLKHELANRAFVARTIQRLGLETQ